MRRTLLWLFVFVMAVVPAANGVCGVGCDFDPQASSARDVTAQRAAVTSTPEAACPLHAGTSSPSSRSSRSDVPQGPTSDRCGHDHTIGRNGLVRATGDATRTVKNSYAVVPDPGVSGNRATVRPLAGSTRAFSPPNRSSQVTVLRI